MTVLAPLAPSVMVNTLAPWCPVTLWNCRPRDSTAIALTTLGLKLMMTRLLA